MSFIFSSFNYFFHDTSNMQGVQQNIPSASISIPQILPTSPTDAPSLDTRDAVDLKQKFTDLFHQGDLEGIKALNRTDLKNLGSFPISLAFAAHSERNAPDNIKSILEYLVALGCQIAQSNAEQSIIYDFPFVLEQYLENRDPNTPIPAHWMWGAAEHSQDQRTIDLLYHAGIKGGDTPEHDPMKNACECDKFANFKRLYECGYELNPKYYNGSDEFIRFLWEHKIPLGNDEFIQICNKGICIDVLEECLDKGLEPTLSIFLALLESKNEKLGNRFIKIIDSIHSIDDIPKDGSYYVSDTCILEEAIEYFKITNDLSVIRKLLPKYKKVPICILFNMVDNFMDTLWPLFIEQFAYTKEMVSVVFEMAHKNEFSPEWVKLFGECLKGCDSVCSILVSDAFECAPLEILRPIAEKYKGNDLQQTWRFIDLQQTRGFNRRMRSPQGVMDVWEIFKDLGFKASASIVRGMVEFGLFDLVNYLFEEDKVDFSDVKLHTLIHQRKFSPRLFHLLEKFPLKIETNDIPSLPIEAWPIIIGKLRKRSPELRSDKQLEGFCKKCMRIVNSIHCNKNPHWISLGDADFIELLKKIKGGDPTIPLHLRLIAELPSSWKIWSFLFPDFNAPRCLLGYSCVNFDLPLYKEIYEHLVKICDEEPNTERESCAYKLSMVFANAAEAIKYLDGYKQKHRNCRQPVHDACIFEPPPEGTWNKNLWQRILKKQNYSMRWFQLFSFAPQIEGVLSEKLPLAHQWNVKNAKNPKIFYREALMQLVRRHPDYGPELKNKTNSKDREQYVYDVARHFIPDDVDALEAKLALVVKTGKDNASKGKFHALMDVIYSRRCLEAYEYNSMIQLVVKKLYVDIDPVYFPFALDCIKGGITKVMFNKILKLCKEESKRWDLIPDVDFSIELDDIRKGPSKYRVLTLKMNDPYGGILGKMTSCCQSIDGNGNDSALHGMQSPYGGFLVIYKEGGKKSFVAQSWMGITERGEIVLDSIENNQGCNHRHIMALVIMAAQEMVRKNPKINGVFYGTGGNTPQWESFELDKNVSEYSPIIGYKTKGYDSVQGRKALVARDPQRNAAAKVETSERSPQMSSDGILVVPGIDTYVAPGKKINDLSLNVFDRSLFFERHPNATKMMKEHANNPLVEEGRFESPEKRARFGEYFIPFAAVKLLVEEKIIKRAQDITSGYRADHVVLVDNDSKKLKEELANISLEEGQNILVGSIEGVHAIFAYIEKVDGKMRAVVVDPENPQNDGSNLFAAIRSAFPGVKLAYTKDGMQVDLYSCSTFLIKSMMAFAKDGHNLTDEIFANQGRTPAKLLKMSQKRHHLETLSDEMKNTIVSKKKNLTLAQYLQKEAIVLGDRAYNGAALRRKYRCLHTLEEALGVSLSSAI